ncbi:hypothetical protein D3C81_436700 [compost metagenome]
MFGAAKGLLSVDAGHSRWVVPATHAVWIPPGVPHGLQSHGPFSGWSLYVKASVCDALPAEPCVLAVSGLLREAVARAASWQVTALDAAQARLVSVILDEIGSMPRVELGLPMPRDARLLRIARALSNHPEDGRTLDEWARWAGIAPRTLDLGYDNVSAFIALFRRAFGVTPGRYESTMS